MRPRPGALARPLSAVALASALSTTAVAAAAPVLPRLAVHRTPDAMDCPDAAALAAAVDRLMKRHALTPSESLSPSPPEGPSPAPVIDVFIRGGQSGYTASVQAGGRTREISDPWPTCAGLAEGLPLTLAILLDSDESLTNPPAPTPAAQATSSPPGAPSAPSLLTPRPALAVKTTGLTASAGAAITSGLLGPLSFAVGGDADLRFSSMFAVGAGAFWVAPRTLDFAPGTVNVSLWAGLLRACTYVVGAPDRVRLGLCGHAAVGVLEGQGSGYVTNKTSTRPWIAFGAAGLLEGPIWKRIGWAARVSFFIPAVKERFAVDEDIVFEPGQVGIFVGLGPRVTIW